MCRLVSGYYQKFIKLAKHGSWAPKIRRIISTYRARPNSGDLTRPSPEEVVRSGLSTSMSRTFTRSCYTSNLMP